jgi:anti-sigma B factor antagonist
MSVPAVARSFSLPCPVHARVSEGEALAPAADVPPLLPGELDPIDHVDAFRLSVSRAGDTVTVIVVGEVDVATAEPLRDCVGAVLASVGERRLAERVVVQFDRVSFIDASGLGALVALRRMAHREGTPLTLAGVAPAQWRLLVLTGLTGLVDPCDVQRD